MSGKIEARLKELGIELPQPGAPVANYVPYTASGNLIFVSGQLCVWNGERRHVGKLDAPGVEEGVRANKERVGTLAHESCERRIDVAAGTGLEDLELHADGAGGRLHVAQHRFGTRRIAGTCGKDSTTRAKQRPSTVNGWLFTLRRPRLPSMAELLFSKARQPHI